MQPNLWLRRKNNSFFAALNVNPNERQIEQCNSLCKEEKNRRINTFRFIIWIKYYMANSLLFYFLILFRFFYWMSSFSRIFPIKRHLLPQFGETDGPMFWANKYFIGIGTMHLMFLCLILSVANNLCYKNQMHPKFCDFRDIKCRRFIVCHMDAVVNWCLCVRRIELCG